MERTYQLNYNTMDDDPFGDGQLVTAKDVAQLADLIEQHVILGDYCRIFIEDREILEGTTKMSVGCSGSAQLYHRNNPAIFTECLSAYGTAKDLMSELNACRT